MSRTSRLALALFIISFAAGTAPAQVATGTPPFGSFGGGPDIINLANLNSHITVPVLHKPGRGGMNFNYDLNFDSSIWYPVGSSGSQSWQPVSGWGWNASLGGYLTYATISGIPCYANNTYATLWMNFVYYDTLGTSHPFNFQIWNQPCGPSSGTGTTTDGSGLTFTASVAQGSSSLNTSLMTRDGTAIYPPVASASGSGILTDRNGNQISWTSGGIFTDTLGTTVLTVTGSGTPTSPMKYTYSAPGPNGAGVSVPVVVNYANYTVATNFGVSGISEYKSSAAVPLVSSIVLPDGSQYFYSYEATPSIPAVGACTPYAGTTCVTARVTSITLPTGGAITYAYTGGNNGIFSDGSTATLTRTTPDGTWTYARMLGTGAASATTVTAPKLPYDSAASQTIIQFQSIYETQRNVYQGSAPTFSSLPITESTLQTANLLQETQSCYNITTIPCTSTSVALPISQKTVTIQIGPSGPICKHVYFYSGFGVPTETDDYDYGSAGPGALLRKVLVTYAPLTNINAFRKTISMYDGNSNLGYAISYNYDETSPQATSGTPQHTIANGSRGNVTSILIEALTKTLKYFDTGNVQTVTDVNGAATTYTYSSLSATCGNAFPDGVTGPLGISQSMSWNCTGGVQTSLKDENNQTTSYGYNDPYFWRINAVTDPLGNQKGYYYQPNPTWASPSEIAWFLTFNNGNSVASDVQYMDGLGRTYVDQRRQSPNSPTLDSVSYTYDSNGRPYSVSVPCAVGWAGTCPTLGTTQTYDALNRPLQTADGGGGYISYSYSNNDVLVTVGPAPLGEKTKQRQLEYDSLGRLTSVCEITAGTTSAPAGTCAQTSSQTGYWTKYQYDAAGHLTRVTQNAQAASGQQQVRYYIYDGLGRLRQETNPENGTTYYVTDYDPGTPAVCPGNYFGDIVRRFDAQGNTTCYAYDALHRVTSATYSGPYATNTPNKYFVYDSATVNGIAMANGQTRLVEAYTAPSPAGTKITDIGFTYTARGEVSDIYQSTPHSSGYYHVNQTYWAHGLPAQLSQLSGLPAITYGGTIGTTVGLDGEGRITQVTAASGQNPVTNTTYNISSLPTQVTLGSADTDLFAYDPNTLRMTQYKFNVGTPPQSVTGALSWNVNNTLGQLAITDQFNASDTQICNYAHDDLMRIASANCGSAAQTFAYDSFGNINKSGSPYSFQPTYDSATNRFSTIPGAFVSYDTNGNVLSDGSHTYAWDADGNSISLDGFSLTFDALDRVVEQARGANYTQIVYSPTGGKLALMGGQTLQKAFVSLPGQATAVYTSNGLDHYRHSDWLGSARLTSTPLQTVSSTTAYAPFGETYAQSGTLDSSFTGLNPDTVSGDYDFLFREYSTQGRWTSPDPAGLAAANPAFPQSWNRYGYVVNNPLSFVDPLGLLCLTSEGVNTSAQNAGQCNGTWIEYYDSVTVTAPAPGFIQPGIIFIPSTLFFSGGSNTSGAHGWVYYFFKDFSVFGPKNDPRPSCFAGFLKGTVENFFGYSGADVAGGVASATYILTPPSPVPPTMALRGGKYARNWIKADQAARVGKAAKTGLLVNLVFAEGLALGSEVDSALNGNCK